MASILKNATEEELLNALRALQEVFRRQAEEI
jgi:hypothetical protein